MASSDKEGFLELFGFNSPEEDDLREEMKHFVYDVLERLKADSLDTFGLVVGLRQMGKPDRFALGAEAYLEKLLVATSTREKAKQIFEEAVKIAGDEGYVWTDSTS